MITIVNEIQTATVHVPYTDVMLRTEVPAWVFIHRDSVGPDVQSLAKFFADNPKYTGGRFPYTFVIYPGGQVSQCVSLKYRTADALAASRTGVSVCLLGDFRRSPPTRAQQIAAADLCTALLRRYPTTMLDASHVRGHTEESGRSKDPLKQCPGRYLNMSLLREDIADRLQQRQFVED